MNECLCCSHRLLRHIQRNQIYWYCSNCRQEMPNRSTLQQQSAALSHKTRSLRQLVVAS